MAYEYELLEDIEFEGWIYPPTCDECGERLGSKAIVFPEMRKIFCDDTDCAANWFAQRCRYINNTREEGTPCIPN